MNGSLRDIVELLVAVAGGGVLLMLPSVSLAHLADLFGARRLDSAALYPVALVVGYAVLPIADSLVARALGLDAALALNLALAGHGAWIVRTKGFPWPARPTLVACMAGLAILIAVAIDIDTGDKLYPSLLVVDAVKHAAVTRALAETGTAPPFDPFFLRDQAAGYYYFYYIASALVQRLGFGLIDARAAMFGQVPWTALALVGTTLLVWRRARLGRAPTSTLLAFMSAAGLQITTVAMSLMVFGVARAQINWWGEQVTAFATSVIWVPHHLAGMIATWAALLALAPIAERDRVDGRRDTAAIVVAAAALASAMGLSVWLAFGAVATFALWLVTLVARRRWRASGAVVLAGILALVIAAPDLIDIVRNRAHTGPALEIAVRSFPLADVFTEPGWGRTLLRLVMLPLNYLFEFGVFMAGAALYWRDRKERMREGAADNETARLLLLSALASLVLASFLRSTILNNDLGWRVILFAQFAALMWTVAAVGNGASTWAAVRRAPTAVIIALVIGWTGVAYDFLALRAYRPLGLTGAQGPRRDPAADHDRRAAYEWLNRHAPPGAVTQHNPDPIRAYAYGLYGRHSVAVADRHNSVVLGADPRAVGLRLADLIPVFTETLPAAEALRRLEAEKVDIAVVAADDPVWRDPASFVWQLEPLRAWPNVRLIAVPGARP